MKKRLPMLGKELPLLRRSCLKLKRWLVRLSSSLEAPGGSMMSCLRLADTPSRRAFTIARMSLLVYSWKLTSTQSPIQAHHQVKVKRKKMRKEERNEGQINSSVIMSMIL